MERAVVGSFYGFETAEEIKLKQSRTYTGPANKAVRFIGFRLVKCEITTGRST